MGELSDNDALMIRGDFSSPESGQSKGIYYGWVVVLACLFLMSIGYGMRFSFSVFFVAILKEFSWSRGAISGAFSLNLILSGLISPLVGSWADRLGSRKVMVLGSMVFSLGFFSIGFISAVWHLYLFLGVLLAFGVALVGVVPISSLMVRWFQKNRGVAVGLSFAGVGLGILIFAPLAQVLISWSGWRVAFHIFGGLAVGMTLPMALFLVREKPDPARPLQGFFRFHKKEEFGGERKGDGTAGPAAPPGGPLSDMLRARPLHLLAGASFLTGFGIFTILVHHVAHLVDIGFSGMTAASIYGFIGILNCFGKVTMGHLSDRLGREKPFLLSISLLILGVSVLISLKLFSSPAPVFLFAVCFAFGYGGVVTLFPSLTGDLFSGPRFASIFGVVEMGLAFGGALGSWMGGFLFDLTSSYTAPFLMAILGFFLSGCFVWSLRTYPRPIPLTARSEKVFR